MNGKKTYIAAALLALGSLGAWLAGQSDLEGLVQGLLSAAALAGLRHAIEKK